MPNTFKTRPSLQIPNNDEIIKSRSQEQLTKINTKLPNNALCSTSKLYGLQLSPATIVLITLQSMCIFPIYSAIHYNKQKPMLH